LQARGLDTLNSETAIVPVICGSDADAFAVIEYDQKHNIFVLPVFSPAVRIPLRATVLTSHEPEDIEKAMDIIAEFAEQTGIF
jgi:glycine C-acetyltransferase